MLSAGSASPQPSQLAFISRVSPTTVFSTEADGLAALCNYHPRNPSASIMDQLKL